MPKKKLSTKSTSETTKSLVPTFEHLLTWAAPERYWVERPQSWYVIRAAIFVAFILLAALTEQYLLIIALIALMILLFAQASIPPRIRHFVITNQGLKAYDNLYRWKDVTGFWFSEKHDITLSERINSQPGYKYLQINFEMPTKNPARLSLLTGELVEAEFMEVLLKYIPYSEVEDVNDDILSRLIYGKFIDFKSFLPTEMIEYLPETDELPAQEIEYQKETSGKKTKPPKAKPSTDTKRQFQQELLNAKNKK